MSISNIFEATHRSGAQPALPLPLHLTAQTTAELEAALAALCQRRRALQRALAVALKINEGERQ